MQVMKKYFYVVILLMVFQSCKKEESALDISKLQYDYYPTEIGTYVIYDVDSTTYNDFYSPILVTNSRFQIKEKIESEFEDNLGRPSLRIERYIRNNESETWKLLNVWYATRTERALERVEDNLRFIKFTFPPAQGQTWNGNTYIDQSILPVLFKEDWNYEMTDVNKSITLAGQNYDSTVTVIQKNYIDNDLRYSVIEKVYAKEIYGKGIGMIYKELWNLQRQSNSNKSWLESAENGYIITYTAIAHGVE
jgi:hypothetical protein